MYGFYSVSIADKMPDTNSHFDEKSGIVECKTEWGRWYQTVAEVVVEVDLEPGTRGKDVDVTIQPNKLTCAVRQKEIFAGVPFDTVSEDDSIWTIEDRKLLRIQCVKAHAKTKDMCWTSLLKNGQFMPDVRTLNEMRKKLDLEQFQKENPGFDFSNAKLDKRYEEKSLSQMKAAVNQ